MPHGAPGLALFVGDRLWGEGLLCQACGVVAGEREEGGQSVLGLDPQAWRWF